MLSIVSELKYLCLSAVRSTVGTIGEYLVTSERGSGELSTKKKMIEKFVKKVLIVFYDCVLNMS